MSNDSFLIQLDEKGDWFLGADSAQWIILRKRVSKNAVIMQGQSFIGSTRTMLLQTIKSYDIDLVEKAKEQIDSFPEKFLDFVVKYETISGKGRRKKVDTDD